MRVKNLKGTSSHSCNCGTWLNHWKSFSGYYRISPSEEIFCSVIGCRNKATDGGHVKKISSGIARAIPESNNWYIVPLCKQCNQRTDEFDIDNNVSLVSANIAETCGRFDEGTDIRRAPVLGEPQSLRRVSIGVPDDQPLRRLVPARREVIAENQALRRELISRVPDDPKNASRSRFNK